MRLKARAGMTFGERQWALLRTINLLQSFVDSDWTARHVLQWPEWERNEWRRVLEMLEEINREVGH